MENCEYDNKVDLKNKTITPFVIGIILTVATAIIFFVGMFNTNHTALWITTAVISGVSLVCMGFSAHSVGGWIRMFSILFVIAHTVILTYMATVTWA